MYFSRLQLDLRQPEARRLLHNSYHEHQQLWQLFEEVEPAQGGRAFLYRRAESAPGVTTYYSVSPVSPLPDHALWRVESKAYAPSVTAGQMLAFSLRANPVITRRDEAGRSSRHDVVMDLKRQRKAAGEANVPQAALERQAGLAWLQSRAEKHGFAVVDDSVLVSGYCQQEMRKPKNSKPLCLSTLDFEGRLQVTDPDAFSRLLFQGIGPAKGFGCGLMLVRRI